MARLALSLRAACPKGIGVYFDHVGGVLVALVLAGCGNEGPWQKVAADPVADRPMKPAVVAEVPGTGAKVRVGDVVEVDIEILEPATAFFDSVKGQKRRVWVFAGSTPSGELGSESARRLLDGRSVATQLTIDAKTGSTTDYGNTFLPDQPFGSRQASITVYGTVYRMHILRACPAELSMAKVSRTHFAFNLPCKGEFLPSSCSWPTLWKSGEYTRHRITATCGSDKLDFRTRVKGD